MLALPQLIAKGGPVMIAIIALSVILYGRCFSLLLTLRRALRDLKDGKAAGLRMGGTLRRRRQEMQESFRQQRITLGAMIAAAPLLGLLGTVSGMARTFESLSMRASQGSMEKLAGGISQVLVATESGLAVAIPALLLVHLAHREVRACLSRLNQIEQDALEESAA